MLIDKLKDPVLLGKLLGTISQFVLVIVAPLLVSGEQVNILFQVLAWSSIMAALGSFGSNAALTQFLHTKKRFLVPSAIVSALLLLKFFFIFASLFIVDMFGLFGDVGSGLLLWTSLLASLAFLDYVAEARGVEAVYTLSKIKVLVFSSTLLIKIALLWYSFNILLWVIYLEWAIVWVVYAAYEKRKGRGAVFSKFSLADIRELIRFLKSSSWVWVSAICQLGWTRGFFLILNVDLGVSGANMYFLFLRVVEAFAFIPNALSMKYFSRVIRIESKEKCRLRLVYVKNMRLISILVATFSPVFLGALVFLTEKTLLDWTLFMLLSISAYFFIMRIALSREIVLNNVLYLSLVSYLSAVACSLAMYWVLGGETLTDALISYAVFSVMSFLIPLILNPRVFEDFILALIGKVRGEFN